MCRHHGRRRHRTRLHRTTHRQGSCGLCRLAPQPGSGPRTSGHLAASLVRDRAIDRHTIRRHAARGEGMSAHLARGPSLPCTVQSKHCRWPCGAFQTRGSCRSATVPCTWSCRARTARHAHAGSRRATLQRTRSRQTKETATSSSSWLQGRGLGPSSRRSPRSAAHTSGVPSPAWYRKHSGPRSQRSLRKNRTRTRRSMQAR
mmetsp:Transcript_36592/g.105430  ORF Transcript_36592/g.105430 Transcript_36592/m.105430 type:complete len:202 (+) Transcript_36592:331-936(+)